MEKVLRSRSLPDLLEVMPAYFEENGFSSCFYFSAAPGTRGNAPEGLMEPMHHGFSPEVVRTYLAANFQRLDVVPRTAMALGVPVRWTEAWASVDATPEERGFLQLMRELEIGDGFTMPCYGPNGRDGYVGIGRMAENARVDEDALREMHMAAQAMHLRICEFLAGRQADDRPLSGREREVLDWVARGKSNSVIAEILGISVGTVDTYLRRIYDKLDVTDRTSAAVRGIGMGLIAA
ncbi:LuxR family transcriptional regulator [Novosphingobium sp. HK4-1]|uniref:LuxR family transcriptional regulator n=2 Tax=Novosphingobium mangrovi (ex Huang et al. 2023) TaxID=2976432 RepID=A0ABT2I8A1_9SPHN|nr:LuxR family transcriptional regulator [Novosphingobium mangrovi (ex Huang et al. 2023)]